LRQQFSLQGPQKLSPEAAFRRAVVDANLVCRMMEDEAGPGPEGETPHQRYVRIVNFALATWPDIPGTIRAVSLPAMLSRRGISI